MENKNNGGFHMFTLKVIVTILNLTLAGVIFYFSHGLSWSKPDDRFSICGFWTMIAVYFINSALLWV